MSTTSPTHDVGTLLAEMLAYPSEGYAVCLDETRRHLREAGPQAAEHIERFAAAIEPLTLDEHEELFTRTFDINPIGALEIGWHLFGEDYHRGTLLARLRVELRRHGIPESAELPDHLTHVLRLLDRMAADEAEEFTLACVLPALDKLLDGFRGKENPYEHLLCCTLGVLQARFGAAGARDRAAAIGARGEHDDDPFRQELLPILDDWPTPAHLLNAPSGWGGPATSLLEERP